MQICCGTQLIFCRIVQTILNSKNRIIMADIMTKEERSRNMSAIHSKDTGPEVYFRKLLFANGIRYRKNVSYIPGHPDLYLKKYNTAVFINGCFWHRHSGCKYAYTPKTRVEFWGKKFSDNIMRDQIVREELKQKGIKQLIIWECTIETMKRNASNDAFTNLVSFMNNSEQYMEL